MQTTRRLDTKDSYNNILFWVNPTPVGQAVEGRVRHHEEPLGRQELRYEEEGLALKARIRQSLNCHQHLKFGSQFFLYRR